MVSGSFCGGGDGLGGGVSRVKTRIPQDPGRGTNERAISGLTRRRRRARSAPGALGRWGIERGPFSSGPRQEFAIYGGSARYYEWARMRSLDASFFFF